MDPVDLLEGKLLISGLATKRELVGCSARDIKALEDAFRFELPEVYKEFLRRMGRKAGNWMVGTDMFFRHMPDLRKAFEEALVEDEYFFELRPTNFVFSSHQG